MPRSIMNWVGSLSLIVFGFFATFASPLAQEKRPCRLCSADRRRHRPRTGALRAARPR